MKYQQINSCIGRTLFFPLQAQTTNIYFPQRQAAAYFQMEETQKISLLQSSSGWDVNHSDSKQLATSFAARC